MTELGQSGTTGADGVADFGEVPAGSYTAVGQKDNFAPPSSGDTTAPASQTQSAPASTSTQIALVLDPIVAKLSVHVQTTAGVAVDGVTVSVDGKGWSGVTNATGDFDFGDVAPDNYTITGEKPGYGPVPATQAQQVTAGTSAQCMLVMDPATVTLTLDKPLLTLKHDNIANIQVTVTPAGITVDAYRIEIRRGSEATWATLSPTAVLNPFTARISGVFKLRGVATIQGAEKLSSEVDMTVQYPTYAQVVGDGNVQSAVATAWTGTLADCTSAPNQRREYGFWINLNTTSGNYEFGTTVFGPFTGPTGTGSVNLPPRPPDVPAAPAAIDPGATYPVASFHSHTPTEFRATAMPPGSIRPIGPSSADNRADNNDDVPGVVYDYTESPGGSGSIPMGYPKGSAAQYYHSQGKMKRTTPP